MGRFTTRVELHDAEWSDYTLLHAEMKKRGFSQTVTSDDGKTYDLPPAEYNFEANISRSDVLERAKAAAGTVKNRYGVLVTESAGRVWHGLEPTKVAA